MATRDNFDAASGLDAMFNPQTPSERLLAMEHSLNMVWLGHTRFIRGVLAALLARQHAIVIGPPGEAKSAVIDDIRKRISGANSFKYVLTKFTTPDEIFGAVDILALKEGRYERLTHGYYPEAHVAFLDEVGKASSSLANAFLQSMNEREVVLRGDRGPTTCNLISCFGASNEALDKKELGAFWDRFLLRFKVQRLKGAQLRRFLDLEAQGVYASHAERSETTLALADLETLQRQVAPRVTQVTARTLELYEEILRKLQEEGLDLPSTRRSGWNMHLVRANAVLNGRTQTEEADLAPLADTLWENPGDAAKVSQIVLKTAAPRLAEAQSLFDDVLSVEGDVMEFLSKPENQAARASKAKKLIEGRSKIADLGMKMRTLYNQAVADGASDATELRGLVMQAGELHEQLKRLSDTPANTFLSGMQQA